MHFLIQALPSIASEAATTKILGILFLLGSIANVVVSLRLNRQNKTVEGWKSAAEAARVERDAQKEKADRKEEEHRECEQRLGELQKRITALEAKTDLDAFESRMSQQFKVIVEALTTHFQSDTKLQGELVEKMGTVCEGIENLLKR
jgi:small-conductance mechanosensitive channel